MRSQYEFQTIRSEGGLLPADVLRRVLDPSAKLEGTRPTDYGLPPGERPSEAITQSWNRLQKHWKDFRSAAQNLSATEPGTGLTNEKWSIPLLRELGFGMLPATAAREIGGKTYAINRFFGETAIHLVGCQVDLDRRARGIRGAAVANPHGLLQDFLNRSPANLWGILSNGLRMRILRDSQAIVRESYLEFDLEAMFDGEVFSDFVVFWLVAHATRFASRADSRQESCWLERWTELATEQGARALRNLREGVEKALEVLGQGLVGHPHNAALRDALRNGELTNTDFHGQLLRIVYRLIFLFVAEDRTLDGLPLLHPKDGSTLAQLGRSRYATHYSAARLRRLAAEIRGSRHCDLWHQVNLVVGALSGEKRFQAVRDHLSLPALGSYLWSPASTAHVNATNLNPTGGAELANADLLEAIRNLSYTRLGRTLRPVNYRNLGSEELGGVYEGLLALSPQVSDDGTRFFFIKGTERKKSGSYYTDDSLVQSLLDAVLDPVIEAAIAGKSGAEAEKAILNLKVCDPAVGSGHFLVAAAHRLSRHLARVRATIQGDGEPSPALSQHAIRDVIAHCLYGVDMNPMAAELCRVSLWLEALEPGKPLSFLDHHIRVGNSLLGITPEMIAAGLPDGAFSVSEGDDKDVCAQLRKRNKAERAGFSQVLLGEDARGIRGDLETVTRAAAALGTEPDDTVEAVQQTADRFYRLIVSPEYQHAQKWADAWCAAFPWPKTLETLSEVVTTGVLQQFEVDPGALTVARSHEIERLSSRYRFFHWHLAFPEVFDHGGFDCVLGNPPWEKLQVEEQEFFTGKDDTIATASGRARKRAIAALGETNPELEESWQAHRRDSSAIEALLKRSGCYPLAGVGKLNTYALFVELSMKIVRPSGYLGLVTPLGLITDKTGSILFGNLVSNHRLAAILGFENESLLFPDVHHSTKFCLLVAMGSPRPEVSTRFAFYCRSVEDLSIPGRLYSLRPDDIARMNPNTLTCPIFRNGNEASLVRLIYARVPVIAEARDPLWKVAIQRILNSTDDAEIFLELEAVETRDQKYVDAVGTEYEPVYEAKMFHQFDHRFGTYVGQTEAQSNQGKLPELTEEQHRDPQLFSQPRWWVQRSVGDARARRLFPHEWVFVYRDTTSPVVKRSAIAAILPHFCTTETCRCVFFNSANPIREAIALLTSFNSLAFDFVCRTKFSGNHLSTFIVEQLPPLPPNHLEAGLIRLGLTWEWLTQRVLELTYTASDLKSFARDCGWEGPPFVWDDERRFVIRAELDAALFHLYFPSDEHGKWLTTDLVDASSLGPVMDIFPVPRAAVAYVMDTFTIIRGREEEAYGSYRTKAAVLAVYDQMLAAKGTATL